MSRFALKIYALLLVMGAIPLLASALLIGEILTFNRDLQTMALETLDNVSAFHRAWARSEGERVKLIGETLARTPEVRDPATAEDALSAAVSRHDVLYKAELVNGDVVLASAEAKVIDADKLKLAERTWSVGDDPRAGSANAGKGVRLNLTFGIERSYTQRFEELGDRRSLHRGLILISDEEDGSFDDVYRTFYFSMLALVIVLTVGFAVLITTPVSRRLARLAAATKRVGKGDLEVRVEVKGRDEISQLTDQFNRMVEELGEARRKVAYLERLSAWQEVARRLAHEIKNPLTPLLLSVQQLDRTFDKYREKPDVYRTIVSEVVEIVTEEVETLRVLVKNFSEFAKLPAADPKPRPLWAFVEQTVRSNPQFAESATVRLHDGAPVHAKIDSILMRRVLVNIIQNAIEAVSEEGHGQHPEIDIELVVIDEMARLIIRDNGPGISPEHVERVFEPYFTTKDIGTGLGLAIVRKILIDHGGDIRLGPRLDEAPGAEAWIELPALVVERRSTPDAGAVAVAVLPDDDGADTGDTNEASGSTAELGEQPGAAAPPSPDDASAGLSQSAPSTLVETPDASDDAELEPSETTPVAESDDRNPAIGGLGTESIGTRGGEIHSAETIVGRADDAVARAPDREFEDTVDTEEVDVESEPSTYLEPSDDAEPLIDDLDDLDDLDDFDDFDFDDDDFDDDLDDVEVDEDELVDEDGILRRVR